MARRRKTPEGSPNLSDTGTSSVTNRLAAEAERQQAARAERDKIVAETKKTHRATTTRLADKPTDARTIAS